MRILVVEDDIDFIEALKEILQPIVNNTEIVFTNNKTQAMSEIKENFFDLIILDLNIPVDNGSLDGNPNHGHFVFMTARRLASGTPVIVLTGSSAQDFIDSMLSMSEKKDIWGSGKAISLVAFHQKHKLDTFPNILKEYTDNFFALKSIELNRNTLLLTEAEDRLTRIFSRSVGGVFCNLSIVNGGLSKSHVFRLEVKNVGGEVLHDAICKISVADVVRDEDKRYDRYVSRLRPDATPRKITLLEHGAKDMAGVFYGLADGFTQNAFSTQSMSESAVTIISTIESLLQNWTVDSQVRVSISDIRERMICEAAFREVLVKFPLAWANDFETNHIQVKAGCAHGDLHGLNILISESGTPILIDYGDSGVEPSSIDPLTLELSIFFHPEGPLRFSEWPSEEQAKCWGDMTKYLDGCPFPDFIKACREWAKRISAGDREIAAVAYSYLIRQLKYPEINHQRALHLLEGVKLEYDRT